jgi:O-antigen ligase
MNYGSNSLPSSYDRNEPFGHAESNEPGQAVPRTLRLPAWFQISFWATLLVWSYVPYKEIAFYIWNTVPFKSTDILLFVLLVLALAAGLIHRYRNHVFQSNCLPLLTTMSVFLGYSALTMTWADLVYRDQIAMGYTLISGAACFLVPYLVFRQLRSAQIHTFLWRLSIALAIISFSYFAQSFLALGLRSRNDWDLITFGMERVGGPLLYPARLHFQLLPAAAFVLGEMLTNRARRMIALPLLCMFIAPILGAGSRSGAICLGLFILLVALVLRGTKRVSTVFVLLVLVTSGVTVLLTRAIPDRLMTGDPQRSQTYDTALAIVESQTLNQHIFGAGYGHWWPWYILDIEDGGAMATGRFFRSTPYGFTLYNPHSLLLTMWVELGIIGLCLFLVLMFFLLQLALRAQRRTGIHVLMCGLAALVPAFFVDCYIVEDIKQNLIWWCFVLGATALSAKKKPATGRLPWVPGDGFVGSRDLNAPGLCPSGRSYQR